MQIEVCCLHYDGDISTGTTYRHDGHAWSSPKKLKIDNEMNEVSIQYTTPLQTLTIVKTFSRLEWDYDFIIVDASSQKRYYFSSHDYETIIDGAMDRNDFHSNGAKALWEKCRRIIDVFFPYLPSPTSYQQDELDRCLAIQPIHSFPFFY